MQIDKKDVFWNYGATFLKIASGTLLLPFILRMMPAEMIGIWAVFMTITAFTILLDFGFSSSFTRNVTYIFSGVKSLKIQGFETVLGERQNIDYGLLKGVIIAMRWFYLRIAISLFVFLVTFGTWYVYTLLQNYKGDPKEVYVAWIVLCLINTYNLYSLYYDSLLQGKGLIKRSKQIVIIGQTVYLGIAAILTLAGFGLIAIVAAQASSVIIIRLMSYYSFFTHDLQQKLNEVVSRHKKEILKAITPNALKIGVTSLGGFMALRSAIIIGSFYLPLEEIASYGITMQLIGVIAGLAGIYTATYQPKIAQLRVENNNAAIKELYLKGQVVLLFTFFSGGMVLLFFGDWGLNLIGSQTKLIPTTLIFIAIVASLLENNHAIAGGILLTKNEVPFFKAAILSGGVTVLLLLLLFYFTNMGLWGMIIAPAIAQGMYQNWKWPLVVFKELGIANGDFSKAVVRIIDKKSK
jgi:O-antigen/teichoic acid export membrane protein